MPSAWPTRCSVALNPHMKMLIDVLVDVLVREHLERKRPASGSEPQSSSDLGEISDVSVKRTDDAKCNTAA